MAEDSESGERAQVVVVGPGGVVLGTAPGEAAGGTGEEDAEETRSITDLVEQPAKVMRIGTMIKQLLDEVKSAPLDEASRRRLREIHHASVAELEKGLAPELVEELERLSLPFSDAEVPTEAELRITQAQLVGWLEGLFHGIQTALFAQQMAARAQLEQMRRALPQGPEGTGPPAHASGPHAGQQGPGRSAEEGRPHLGSGMYL